MSKQRYHLPEERPSLESLPTLLRRGWLSLLALAVPPLCGYVWRGFHFGDWGWGFAGLAISAGFALAAWHGWLTRITNANAEVIPRVTRPIRYRFTLMVWFIGYLLSVGVFFAGTGTLQ